MLDELNPQQRAAVEQTEGPVLVVAGAGSGKTRVITTRIMFLMEKKVSAYQILAMTFTNKAAQEMKQRVSQAAGLAVRDLTITTFHTFCSRFLRREITYLDREASFTIYDTQDQTTCLKRVIRSLDLAEKNHPAGYFRNKISRIKNSGDLDARPEGDLERAIFEAYQEELASQNALDFDDLLLYTCRVLDGFPECRERYRKRFRYLMVDEYQDTNKVQSRLIRLLLNEDNNLCVVGDEDQSIYGWRGAEIRNILEFEIDYPGARVFKLEQNYRSSQNILDYANTIIAENQLRKPKKLWTSAGPGEPIILKDERNGAHEAESIVQTIADQCRRSQMDYADFAVLFRSNYLSRYLEEMFRRYAIPYQLIGGLKFYDRKEIKDLIAFMRMVVNHRDWVSFSRAMGVPSRGIGAKSLDIMFRVFNQGHTLLETLNVTIKDKLLTRGLKSLVAFRDLYTSLMDAAQDYRPSEWLAFLIQELDYRTYLAKLDELSAESRVSNIEELLSGMAESEEQGITTLSQFMDFSALVSDQDEYDETRPKVSLMTIHAAKGLEFHTVFVLALEEGIFPNQRALNDNPNALEEERRLFYVAVTRAKKRLFLSYARTRQTYGTLTSNPKSRFLIHPQQLDYDRDSDGETIAERSQFPYGGQPKKKVKLADLGSQMEKIKAQLKMHQVDVDFAHIAPVNLKIGDRVSHKKFGNGTVSMVRGSGERQTVTVYFPGSGRKTLVAKMANLKKLF